MEEYRSSRNSLSKCGNLVFDKGGITYLQENIAYSIKELEETVKHFKKSECGKDFSKYCTNPESIKEKIDVFVFVNFCMARAAHGSWKSRFNQEEHF